MYIQAMPMNINQLEVNNIRLEYNKALIEHPEIDDEGRILSEALATKIMQAARAGMPWEVSRSECKDVDEAPPLPQSLDSLQSLLSRSHGMGAAKVLEACQSLYETHKATTYPRTDSQYLPESMLEEKGRVLGGIKAAFPQLVGGCTVTKKPRSFNDGKVTAHHAIIPTGKLPDFKSLSAEEKIVYDAVSRYYMAQFYPDAKFKKTALDIDLDKKFRFTATKSDLLQPGWKAVISVYGKEESAESPQPDLLSDQKQVVKPQNPNMKR
jgi:DNA topoisomerase-3